MMKNTSTRKSGPFVMAAAAVVMGAALLIGCPLLLPFSVEGSYVGTWTGTQGVARDCPLTFTLRQGDAAGEGFGVTGSATMDVACLSPVLQVLEDRGLIEPFTLDLTGSLLPTGSLVLNTAGLLSACSNNYVCLEAAFTGNGEDSNNDDAMDAFDGTYVVTVQLADNPVLDEILSEVPSTIPLTGSFETTATGK